MTKISWMEITKEDVVKALEIFNAENPEFPEPKSTFLIYDGKKYPAKHIRGMAYAVHYGMEISKSDFGGGKETIRFFERLGFDTSYSGIAATKEVKKCQDSPVKKVSKEQCIQTESQKIVQSNENSTRSDRAKIVIPSKQVIEQKNALQLILNKLFDGDIVCEKTYPWLKTPEIIDGEYKSLYKALSLYRGDTTFAKKNVTLRCDFVCEGKKIIIEYDERQHFTNARKVALESYENVGLCFDKSLWIKACVDIGAKDNAPQNRDEIRAYYDSTRDIECYRHGYRLVRIMHGQIDFMQPDAVEKLKALIPDVIINGRNPEVQNKEIVGGEKREKLKVCMYLQTDELKNERNYVRHMDIVKNSDADMVVFPEFCYFPDCSVMRKADMGSVEDLDRVYAVCLDISKSLGRAVVLSSVDRLERIYSVFANAYASEGETRCKYYIKHTMADFSAFEFENYPDMVKSGLFEPILFKGFRIGMTICYDCNHSIFSRMYELSGGIDLIVNSTGGNVVYDKWFKYNKARAIENSCYELVTMGGNGERDNPHCYVYGFNANGGVLKPCNINGSSMATNVPGGLYVYEIMKTSGKAEVDESNMLATANKKWHLEIPVDSVMTVIDKAERLSDNLFKLKVRDDNVILILIDGNDIMKSEKVLPLLYSPQLHGISRKRYIIISRHKHIDETYYREKLSTMLKVRSMENFCAVVLISDNIKNCYQCGKNRTAQVVRATDGFFCIDLDRTTGPEAIWKNKDGMKASWRKHYEWLIKKSADM